MKKAYPLRGICSCFAMLALILDNATALKGARDGLQLILYTVIPALFPFFFLSFLLTKTTGSFHSGIFRMMGRLFRIQDNLEFILLPGFLGGYPAGAQAITTAWERGSVSKDTAESMLAFCSNAGPSFLFGILASKFPEQWMVWLLWVLHIAGALTAARLISVRAVKPGQAYQIQDNSLPEILSASITAMANVCGWLLLFRILMAFLDRWILWFVPGDIRILITGLMELTNGCCMLEQISDVRVRFVMCSILLALGGMCVFLQTQSVTKTLSLRYYLAGKLIQSIFSGSIAAAIMYRSVYPLAFLSIVFFPFLKNKKRSSIPEAAVV